MIAITLDVEWAPDPVLKHTLDLLDEFDIDATLFSTHNDPFEVDRHERALHPNFDTSTDAATSLAELHKIYPDAIGLRSHTMQVSTALRSEWVASGIAYESNYMRYRMGGITPFDMPEGTVQFPVYWMDDVWFRSDGEQVDAETLLKPPGLKVFDFHPPHICFNTPNVSYYADHKEAYWDANPDIDELRFNGFGTRDIFLDLLREISKRRIETITLAKLYQKQYS
jgi:peptidoglycan/xylan/chitin deacetylase (PgdA/CDA1 family)